MFNRRSFFKGMAALLVIAPTDAIATIAREGIKRARGQVGRITTWTPGSVLTAADLNAEFDAIWRKMREL